MKLAQAKKKETDKLLAGDKPTSKLKISKITMKASKSANEFTYELSAFFAAIRSSIDFLARLCGEHVVEEERPAF